MTIPSGWFAMAVLALGLGITGAGAREALADAKTTEVLARLNSAFVESGYFPLDKKFEGNIPTLGVDQVYLDYTLEKVIFVKLKYRPILPEGRERFFESYPNRGAFGQGAVLGVPVTLLFYSITRPEAQEIFNLALNRAYTSESPSSWSLIPSASADECQVNGGMLSQMATSMLSEVPALKALGGKAVEMVSGCAVKALRGAGVPEKLPTMSEVKSGAKSTWDGLVQGIKSAPGEIASGARAVGRGAKYVAEGAWDAAQHPVDAFNKLAVPAAAVGAFFKNLGTNIMELGPKLKSVPPQVFADLLCDFLGMAGAGLLIAAVTEGLGLAELATEMGAWFLKAAKLEKLLEIIGTMAGEGAGLLKVIVKNLAKLPEYVITAVEDIAKEAPETAKILCGCVE